MDDTSKYLGLFVSEATEHVDRLASEVASLAEPPFVSDRVDELFRHAHSIKGMAAAMGFEEIVSLAHAGEQLLGELRTNQRLLPLELVARLTECADRLSGMIQARGAGDVAPAVPALVAALTEPMPKEVAAALKERLGG